LDKVMPDYQERKDWLRDNGAAFVRSCCVAIPNSAKLNTSIVEELHDRLSHDEMSDAEELVRGV
jgi:hypothetical protein